jgi:predicted esterase
MTIVHQKNELGSLMCPMDEEADAETMQDTQPESFDVTGTPLEWLAPNRNYVLLQPRLPKCQSGKCPALIYLHGTAEHAESSDLEKAKEEFARVGKWGMLRYAEHDRECAQNLGTWMIFPQLMVNESFVHDNLAVFKFFIQPLVTQLSEKHELMDMDKLSIVGYSEGAVGAVMAALHRPDLYAFAVASSNVLPSWENFTAYELTPEIKERSKLQAMVLSYGHQDMVGNISESMEVTMNGLRLAGLDTRIRMHIKVYAQWGHDHWEEVFNRWPAMHDLLWNGNYEAMTYEDYAYWRRS